MIGVASHCCSLPFGCVSVTYAAFSFVGRCEFVAEVCCWLTVLPKKVGVSRCKSTGTRPQATRDVFSRGTLRERLAFPTTRL